jgi:chromosome segregation ATPase
MRLFIFKTMSDLTNTELDLEIALAKEQIKKLEEGNWMFWIIWAFAQYPDIGERLKSLELEKSNREERVNSLKKGGKK